MGFLSGLSRTVERLTHEPPAEAPDGNVAVVEGGLTLSAEFAFGMDPDTVSGKLVLLDGDLPFGPESGIPYADALFAANEHNLTAQAGAEISVDVELDGKPFDITVDPDDAEGGVVTVTDCDLISFTPMDPGGIHLPHPSAPESDHPVISLFDEDGLTDDLAGNGGALDTLLGNPDGPDGSETDGLGDDLAGEGGVLDELAGDGGVLDRLLTGDTQSDGAETDGLAEDLLAEGGLVDEVLGDGGTLDDLLTGDDQADGSTTEGVVDGLLAEGGTLDEVLGDGGTAGDLLDDGLVDIDIGGTDHHGAGLLEEDGLIDDLLGDGGTVDSLLTGDDMADGSKTHGVVDDLLSEGGTVDELLGDGGTVDAILTGDNHPDHSETDGLVGGLLDEGGTVDELLGDGGTVDDILTGDNHPDHSETDGLLDALLGDGGTVDELAGSDAHDVGDAVRHLLGDWSGESSGHEPQDENDEDHHEDDGLLSALFG